MNFLSNSSLVHDQEFPQNDISVYGNTIDLHRTSFVVDTLMSQQKSPKFCSFVEYIFACIFFQKYYSTNHWWLVWNKLLVAICWLKQ